MAAGGTRKVLPDIPDALLEKYLHSDVVAVDTELHGLRLVRDQVCLVQLTDRAGNVCLVRPDPPQAPKNLKTLMEHPRTIKIFHYALTDVSFMRTSLGLRVWPYQCTKVMSKLVRTYSSAHGLKDVVAELLGVEMDKHPQQTNWSAAELSQKQLEYAANDVLNLIPAYDSLNRMMAARGKLPTGLTLVELNELCQAFLPTLVELILNGYGDSDDGWETSLYTH